MQKLSLGIGISFIVVSFLFNAIFLSNEESVDVVNILFTILGLGLGYYFYKSEENKKNKKFSKLSQGLLLGGGIKLVLSLIVGGYSISIKFMIMLVVLFALIFTSID